MKFFSSFVALAIAASTANAAYLGHYESTAAPYSKYSGLQQTSLPAPAWTYLDGDRVCEGVRTICDANGSPGICDLYFQFCMGLPNGQNKYAAAVAYTSCLLLPEANNDRCLYTLFMGFLAALIELNEECVLGKFYAPCLGTCTSHQTIPMQDALPTSFVAVQTLRH
ncbi:hypothetical protein K488DRAFT_91410 [Vararia minispora EC-137]|uniref:Uncharacterized protein n=1 Tax=Vararia minispora EC-137 TaxID=1314806 RepID=A0ACB8Q5X9_9AGAM|nr:hypothetical protein K488DRAFT_91410 [Vararia minispora EC-137]